MSSDTSEVTAGGQRVRHDPSEAIVLLGHGSRDAEGVAEFATFARRVGARLGRAVRWGFLELADPPIAVAIDAAVAEGARTIIAVPWLLLGAGHVKNDLAVAVQMARRRHPTVTVRYGAPIGVQPELLSTLGDRFATVDPNGGRGAPDTALLLVERGSSDPEANAEVYRAARLLWEGRQFATVEAAFVGVTQPSVFDGLRRCLTLGARRVIIVPYFLYTGVLVRRIAEQVAEIAAEHPDVDFHVAPHLGQDDRLDTLALRMIERTHAGRATMTCDVCQYRAPLFGREERMGLPQVSDHSHGLRGLNGDHHHHHDHERATVIWTQGEE